LGSHLAVTNKTLIDLECEDSRTGIGSEHAVNWAGVETLYLKGGLNPAHLFTMHQWFGNAKNRHGGGNRYDSSITGLVFYVGNQDANVPSAATQFTPDDTSPSGVRLDSTSITVRKCNMSDSSWSWET
jgi:hypothetical protein